MPWDPGADFVPKTKAFASQVNDKFDSLAAYTDAIPVDDLENGPPGELIICNGSGVPQYAALSGDAVIGPGGGITLKQKTRFHQQTSNLNLIPGNVPGLQTAALEAGGWAFFAKIEIESLGAKVTGAQFQLEKSGLTGMGLFKVSTPGNGDVGLGMTVGVMTSSGTDFVKLTLTNTPAGAAAGTGLRGVLFGMKVS